MSTRLYSAHRQGLTFTEALAAAPGGFALLTTPWRYVVTTTAEARAAVPDGVFEARLFDARCELRWKETDDERGTAVALTEDPAGLPPGFDPLPELDVSGVVDGEYLLWGRAVTESGGWTTLTTERIGSLRVPAVIAAGGHAALTTREYIERDPLYGNAAVVEERLLGLAPSEPVDLRRETA
ncbi:type III-D CRISPR-associated protein Csx19 [Actinomadura flavalba]|uniref:type III-D CRISPR-associated protein Csx19 n=1 Tax=Actinomadura flavalba TaxID=1120938 RepID=UPI00035E3B40|nr:CRISPR-associated protein Csx19 [Actinomadura flavalba]